MESVKHLFLDDHEIEEIDNLARKLHQPEKFERNAVLRPEALAAIHGATDLGGRSVQAALNRVERDATGDPSFRKQLTKDWQRLVKSFGKAVDFLRQNYSVVDRNFLYSEHGVGAVQMSTLHSSMRAIVASKSSVSRPKWSYP